MRRLALIMLLPLSGCAHTYGALSLESSNEDVQTRTEVGLELDNVDVYGYHESDPRNGFNGGRPGENENGIGIRARFHPFK